jgi:VanZ family protein
VLFQSWPQQFVLNLIRDALINIALYVPLGACGYLALKKARAGALALTLPVLLGTTLSIAIELAQVFDATRRPSLLDVLSNATGSILGVMLGIVFSRVSIKLRKQDLSALIVLLCWLAYVTFPFVPTLPAPVVAWKFTAFLHPDASWKIAFISAFASWYTAGFLLRESGVRHVKTWLVMSLPLVPAQLLLFFRQPSLGDLAGALFGAIAFMCTGKRGRTWPATLLVLVVAIRGLAPFHFQAEANKFSWAPFAAPLEAVWVNACLILLEKLFYYAALIWALHFAGLRLRSATAITAVALTILEVAQIYLPGRTPESTDPILALLIGFGIDAIRQTSSPYGTSASDTRSRHCYS